MRIHLVSFDVPFPANYGGVIDVFYKIKALHKAGIGIKLHCFSYGRDKNEELEKYCERVYYYSRNTSLFTHFSSIPYIVKSRKNKELFGNLMRDNQPIIFEGLHTCGYLNHPKLANRLKIVRTHNVEHEYYSQLALNEKNSFKKKYYKLESWKLKRFEKIVHHANHILTISKNDQHYFQTLFEHTHLVPAFHQYETVQSQEGFGMYALYHGNLAVNENEHAAIFLIEEVFSKVDFTCVIAGSGASESLKSKIAPFEHIVLRENISDEEMQTLLLEAHVHILPSFQQTGIKLKLLHSLFAGRFCIVNQLMIENTGLEHFCEVTTSGTDMLQVLKNKMLEEFTEELVTYRKQLENGDFSIALNAQKINLLLNQKLA
jgi:glycosyltransferase involved in cell wall biosynthesis